MAHADMLFPVILSALLSLAASQDAAFWNRQAQQTLQNALNMERNRGVAKNVIFFLGDGMDITTTTAARILNGQLAGNDGEEGSLAWDEMAHVALSKTYNTDQQVADSAGTATAFFCGVKSKAGTVGLDDNVERGDCASAEGAEVDSILVQANRAGKATGLISTARITHATPSAAYAHSAERNWEDDGDIPEGEGACTDIARQLVEENNFINLILGGGRRNFLPNTTLDPEYGYENVTGRRQDGIDLVEYWLSEKGSSARYVWNKTALNAVDIASTDYILGLFEPSHMQYEYARLNDTAGEPSIAEMTEMAINFLSKDEDGYLLLIEGGRIDHAHHDGIARAALIDTIVFHEAVAKAMEMTNTEDTLIIVTSDHGHVVTLGGYPSRGNPIFGFDDSGYLGPDNLPYLTLTYANGPGGIRLGESYNETSFRPDHREDDYEANEFIQDAAIPLDSETHGGADVAIYAHGPWAHLFHGTHEQNYIPHVVRYAACYLDNEDNACTRAMDMPPDCSGRAPSVIQRSASVALALGAVAFLYIAGLMY